MVGVGGGSASQVGDDGSREGRGEPALELRRHQHAGVVRIAHVAALDEHLRLCRKVEAGKVVAFGDAVSAVVRAHRHRGHVEQLVTDNVAEPG